jgi:hypothetical protein
MFYYLYKITNILNNKIYIGVHKTKNMSDGYMGSGKKLLIDIKKYGIDNFKKDILEFFHDEKSMYEKEKEYVTEEFLFRKNVYNIKPGGYGGFNHINKISTKEDKVKAGMLGYYASVLSNNRYILSKEDCIKGNEAFKNKRKNDSEFNKQWLENNKKARDLANSLESIEKRKKSFDQIDHQKGEKNSQFGTCWIYNDKHNKKIKNDELNLYLKLGYVKGRKCFIKKSI